MIKALRGEISDQERHFSLPCRKKVSYNNLINQNGGKIMPSGHVVVSPNSPMLAEARRMAEACRQVMRRRLGMQ